MNHSPKRPALLALALGTALAGQPAAASDVEPGDYISAPGGTNLAIAYGIWSNADRLQTSDGQRVDSKFEASTMLARYVRFIDVGGGIIIDPQIIVPFGQVRSHSEGQTAKSPFGIGDVTLLSTIWLVSNPGKTPTYFGISPFVVVPTGDYDRNRPLNMGENRWKGTLQAGLVQGIAPRLAVDLTGDVTIYGANDKPGGGRRLTQKDSYQIQTYLRYTLPGGTAFSIGHSGSWGGKTYLDGVYTGSRTENQQVRAVAQLQVAKTQIELSAARTVHVVDGYRNDAILKIRLLHAF